MHGEQSMQDECFWIVDTSCLFFEGRQVWCIHANAVNFWQMKSSLYHSVICLASVFTRVAFSLYPSVLSSARCVPGSSTPFSSTTSFIYSFFVYYYFHLLLFCLLLFRVLLLLYVHRYVLSMVCQYFHVSTWISCTSIISKLNEKPTHLLIALRYSIKVW